MTVNRISFPRRAAVWLLIPIVLLVLVGIGVNATVSTWLPRAIVSAPNTDKIVNSDGDPSREELSRLGVARQLRVAVGPPAASLSVWIIEPAAAVPSPRSRPRGTILVLHGVQDRKSSMISAGQAFAAAGYRAVLVDSRGHGRSSGQWLTYGVVESRDLSQVIDALLSQDLAAEPIGAFGVSYGGSTAIMLAGADERVRAVVAVAPFASMQEEVRHYIKSSLVGWMLSEQRIDENIAAAGRLAHFQPADASPLTAIARAKARVLLIHGKADRKIPYQQSASMHAVAADHSELIIIEGEDHDSISCDRTGAIIRRAVEWFNRPSS